MSTSTSLPFAQEADGPVPPLQCPDCGLTLTDLHTQGLMGCAGCYRVFDQIVTGAVAELHGVTPDELPPLTPARTLRAAPQDPT